MLPDNTIRFDPAYKEKILSGTRSPPPSVEGLIGSADEEVALNLAAEHASEPIKNIEDIRAISRWFIERERYRDNMMFIVGINFGLRISDLLSLRFAHLINENFEFRDSFAIVEKKTANTRKVRRNRHIAINSAVIKAVTLYLEHADNARLSHYMFTSESNRGSNQNKPIHRNSAEYVLKEVAKALGLDIHIATHTLRKTFAYHQMLAARNDPRKLLLLQKMFGHSTSAQTLEYIGITAEEIRDAYLQTALDPDMIGAQILGIAADNT
jgi:integrase